MQPEPQTYVVESCSRAVIGFYRNEKPNPDKTRFSVTCRQMDGFPSNAEEFRDKCIRMIESYGWKLIEVERANPVADNGAFSDEVQDILERTRSSPNALV